MKAIRRFIASLLVVSMALALTSVAFAASPKFVKGDYVSFKGNLYGYKNHTAGSRSKVIVKKGSCAKVVDVYKNKWVKLKLGESKNALQLWFGTEKLKKTNQKIAIVAFSSGGSNQSVVAVKPIFIKSYKNKSTKTTGKVNLRSTPSLKGKSRGTLKKGKHVKLTGRVGMDSRLVPFFEIKYHNKNYFVSSVYLNVNAEEALTDLLTALLLDSLEFSVTVE